MLPSILDSVWGLRLSFPQNLSWTVIGEREPVF